MTSGARLAGVVFAAGRSSRMGQGDKLLEVVEGAPLVVHAVRAALEGGLDPLVVVVPPGADALRAALDAHPVVLVENPRARSGMGTSLAAGIRALPPGLAGAMVLLGDMPWVHSGHVQRLVDAFMPSERSVCVPVFGGRRGNPVLWAAGWLPSMMEMDGDQGARVLLTRYPDAITEVEMPDDGVLRDVDTPADLPPGAM